MEERYHWHTCGQSESGRQAGPVSQDQVCQCKQHIQFCGLLQQPSVSGFPVLESALDHSENVLDFCSDRGLLTFTALDLRLGTSGIVLGLRRAAVDFMPDFLAAFVPNQGLLPLFGAKVTTAAVNRIFLTMQQLRRHRYIMDIRAGDFQGMYQPGILVRANVRFIPEVPGVSLFRCMGLRVTLPFRVLRTRRRRNQG